MKKILKTLGVAGIAATTGLTLASCGSTNNNSEFDVIPNITIAVTQDTGTTFTAMKTWLNAAKDELGFTWDYVLASSRNNAENLTTLQNKLISGTDAIISMVDLDATNLSALLNDLERNNAYYAGYETELANARNANLLDNPRIVGAVTDGESGASRGETLFEEVVKTGDRKIVFAQYPENYFPNVKGAVSAFIAKAEEYNQGHTDKFTWYTSSTQNYVNDGTTYKFNFGQQLPAAEYDAWKAADVDAVVAVNSVAKLVYPTTVGKTNPINIYSVGYDDETGAELGKGNLKVLSQTAAEVIIYPLIQILNKIRGNSYADAPTTGEGKVVTGHYIYLTSQEDLTKAASKVANFATEHDMEHTLITPAEAKKLLAGQDGATFAKLVGVLDSWVGSEILK